MIIISKFWTGLLSFGFAKAITIYPFIFLKEQKTIFDYYVMGHEFYHYYDQRIWALGILWYPLYILNFLFNFLTINFFNFREAYRNIIFEFQARKHEEILPLYPKRKAYKKWAEKVGMRI